MREQCWRKRLVGGFGVVPVLFAAADPARAVETSSTPPVVVTASVLVANAILTEAGLAFLGMGDPNVISWGSMIGDGRPLLRTEWFVSAIPGCAIALTVLALNLAGDGLNDVLNPRSGLR